MAYSTMSKVLFSASMSEAMSIIDAAAARTKETMSELTNVINGSLAWSGDDFKDEEAYTLQLHKEELQEVDAALQNFKCKSYIETSFVEANKWTSLTFEIQPLVLTGMK